MDLQSVTSRVHYVSKVVQESEYAKQHAATVIFYNQYKCKAARGIRALHTPVMFSTSQLQATFKLSQTRSVRG